MSGLYSEHYINSGQYLLDDGECVTEWLRIPDHPEYYICKEGYVCRDDHILKPHKGDNHGHLNIRLSKNGVTKEEYLHRLLAKGFIPNPNNYPIVRHLDDDPGNNALENLAWGTQKENFRDCKRNGNAYILSDADREKHLKHQRTPIYAKKSGSRRLYFQCQSDAARELGLQQANIHKVLSGERKHTGGYVFEYAERRK